MMDRPDNIVPITPDARTAAEKFSAKHDRELLTILFTDLVDSTKLQSELGNVEAARLTELHRKIVRDELAKYDAREIEWAGDSCLAVFTKPSDAVVFALRMQAEHRRVRESEPKLAKVRVGMHLGEIVVKKGNKKEDLFGLQVSESARVMSVARGNQIFCTRAVFDNARGSLKGSTIDGVGDVVWVNYGAYMLKGSEDPVELCEIGSSTVAVLKAPEPTDKVLPVLPGGVDAMRALIPYEGDVLPASTRIPRWAFAVAAVLLVLLGGYVGRVIPDSIPPGRAASELPPAPKPVHRLSINLDPSLPVSSYYRAVALSPDGNLLVYTAGEDPNSHLVLRRMGQLETSVVPGTEGASNPFFSPNGEWIGFFVYEDNKLKKVSVRGGDSVSICDAPQSDRGFWGDDGYIVFTHYFKGLSRVAATGGVPEQLTTLADGEQYHASPHVLLGSKTVLFDSVKAFRSDDHTVMAFSYESGKISTILDGAGHPVYTPTGHLVYVVSEDVMAAPFDIETLEFTGSAVSVGESNMFVDTASGFPYGFAISPSGSLAHVVARGDASFPLRLRSLVWVDRNGDETLLDVPSKDYWYPRLSPDGRYLAVEVNDDREELLSDVWIYDLERAPARSRLTFHITSDGSPVWTPDGAHVTFYSFRDGNQSLYRKSADGTGTLERLTTTVVTAAHVPNDWTPDGRSLVFTEFATTADTDLFVVSPGSGEEPRKLLETPFSEQRARISPDGRWIAYESDSSNQNEIYVQGFPEMESKWQISTDGGQSPLWSPDGSELYYRNGEAVMAVPIEVDPAFSVGIPETLFEGKYGEEYDLAPDGERFLMLKPVEDAGGKAAQDSTEIVIVQNWLEKLKRLAPIPEGN